MKSIEEELRKLNAIEIKKQNPVLSKIASLENELIEAFNKDLKVIFGDHYSDIIKTISKNTPNIDKVKTRKITIDDEEEPVTIPVNILQDFHKSYIEDDNLRIIYEGCLKAWFSEKTNALKDKVKESDTYQDLMKERDFSFALASLAVTAFHQRPGIVLRKVQKRTGIAISDGNVAELASGEGKTLAAVLPAFLNALRGRGVHIVTSNNYLSKRDYDELLPIYEGLGITAGYLPKDVEELASLQGKKIETLTNKEMLKLYEDFDNIHREAYKADITFGASDSFAFDYLHDNKISKKEDMIQRVENPGCAIIDEIDDLLIDNGQTPYIISEKPFIYEPGMSLEKLCEMIKLPYDGVLKIYKDEVSNPEKLSYDEARCITLRYCKQDLIESSFEYQRLAEEFFREMKVFQIQNDSYDYKAAKDLYRTLMDEKDDSISDEDRKEIAKYNDILFCEELRQYSILDHCQETLLDYCFINFNINAPKFQKLKDKIINSDTFEENLDYNIVNNSLRITPRGARKINILEEIDDKEVIEEFHKNRAQSTSTSSLILYYFNKAVAANLLYKKGIDYTIDDSGAVKVLNNGRIQEGSVFSDGIHQAIEEKENIEMSKRVQENRSTSSITQKSYYSRYEMFSGMTGTGADFSMYGLGVVKIPRNYAEEYVDNPTGPQPTGVEKKKTQFTLTAEDKANLIALSVEDSLSGKHLRPQPVLIVASNPGEIPLIEEALEKKHIKYYVLNENTPKDEEAQIIASAGTPGYVLITTVMCGRGTDIKVGGDRDTILDICCEKYIKRIEEQIKQSLYPISPEERLEFRKAVEEELSNVKVKDENGEEQTKGLRSKEQEEKYRKDLEYIGLKVISSGVFPLQRLDAQLEGRTGRNGLSGVFERYICPDDLKNIGMDSVGHKESIESFLKREDEKVTSGKIEALRELGYTEINKKNLEEILAKFKKERPGNVLLDEKTYNKIMRAIHETQKRNEMVKTRIIKDSQNLNKVSADLIEEYRDRRRKVICNEVDYSVVIENMVVDIVDSIISSYVIDGSINEKNLTEPINENGLDIDIEAISLEMKQHLGITFDYNAVYKSKMSLLEFRDAAIRTTLLRRKGLSMDNSIIDRKILLSQNDFMLSRINDILDMSFLTKSLTSLTPGKDSQIESSANISYSTTKRKLLYESYKSSLGFYLGERLTVKEFKDLEDKKQKRYSLSVKEAKEEEDKHLEEAEKNSEYVVEESAYEPNNLNMIEKLRAVKRRIDRQDLRKYRRIDHQIEKKTKNKEEIDLNTICSNLRVKPMILMDLMVDGVELNAFSIVPRQFNGQIRFLEEKDHFFKKLLQRTLHK